MAKSMNDRNQAVTKFCLAMEEHRRTDAGRVRTASDLVATFFPHDSGGATDKLFKRMPNEIRGPVIAAWGIRGMKAALKDDDAKVESVIHDALIAGDIDDNAFEQGLAPEILIDWVSLPDWWSFWRSGKLTGIAIQKALATARELMLIDDRWFLGNIEGRGGKLKGTDVVCDTLSKDQVIAWMRKLHTSGDGSPAGIVSAIGWDTILTKTSQDALLFTLDAFARKVGLVPEMPAAAPMVAVKADEGASAADEGTSATDPPDPMAPETRDSGLPVSIPDSPAIDVSDATHEDPPTGEQAAIWGTTGESPKLAEARAKMMEMLGTPAEPVPHLSDWTPSDVPEKPSSLEWPAPPPVIAPVILEEVKPQPSKPPALPKKGPATTPRR